MTVSYSRHFQTKETPQSQPIPGSTQVPNSAGGYAWAVDDWVRLDRFIVLGSENGSYYAMEQKLTVENAEATLRCIKSNGKRVVDRIVEISEAGRAPKNDAALFALAMAAGIGDEKTRRIALDALPRVARIGTHLFSFLENVRGFRGWGRGLRRAVGKWYSQEPAAVAYQVAKYRQRNGWTHRDVLRLASPIPVTPTHNALFRWIVASEQMGDRDVARQNGKDTSSVMRHYGAVDAALLPPIISAFTEAQHAETAKDVVRIIAANPNLTWEMIPTGFLGEASVWEALLPNLPMTALLRNLARMTANGFVKPMSDAMRLVTERLGDEERIRKARVHPIAVLAALMTYQGGHGTRGSLTWEPVSQVTDALDRAFYLSFGNVTPTNKRWLLALDVSGSMDSGEVAGVPRLTPRIASAAMALVTAAVEPDHAFVAFTAGNYPSMWGTGKRGSGIMTLDISPRQRLDDVCGKISGLPFGGTDCALPMIWALENRINVDVFTIYTDSETWHGAIHPMQALNKYRQKMGIPAKLIIVGMVSNGFSIADPNDRGAMDCCGFDTSTPALISNFAIGFDHAEAQR